MADIPINFILNYKALCDAYDKLKQMETVCNRLRELGVQFTMKIDTTLIEPSEDDNDTELGSDW